MSKTPIQINLEFTPNPNTLKYAINKRILATGAENFTDAAEAAEYSPLANKLFGIDGISGVMIGPSFVTITLSDTDNLRELNKQVMSVLKEHLESGELICKPRERELSPEQDETSTRIRAIIENEIRPAVAMDGGDVSFEGYKDGIVYLYMMGACAGCPSASMTLKMGIESRLKQEVPEIVAVEQI